MVYIASTRCGKKHLDESEGREINLLQGISDFHYGGTEAIEAAVCVRHPGLRQTPELVERNTALPSSLSDPKPRIDAAKLRALDEFFPIGKALRYSPDTQLAVVLDTIIVAYCVNDRFIYSRNAIRTDGNSDPSTPAISQGPFELPVHQIQRLYLVVPDTSELERTLDYDRRAIIGRSQQFLEGHPITLIASAGARGVATLETKVMVQMNIDHGPYANSKMILLDPQLETINVMEQLHRLRGNAHAHVALHFRNDEPPYHCALVDFSDSAIGLRCSDNQRSMPAMEPDDSVTAVIKVGTGEKTYAIRGRILRCAADSCAIRLVELLKGNKFSSFSLLDSLQFRTDLLNSGDGGR